MIQALFLTLATLAVLAALGTVLARNLVHAALYLVAFFFLVACQFVLLEAEFLAAVQVLVYIGAVAILMMFGIMLTRDIQGDETTTVGPAARIPAALVSLGFLAMIVVGIGRESGLGSRKPWREANGRPTAKGSPQGRAVDDMARTLGDELMGRYALPFEVAGLLLTVALVGSIAIASRDRDDDPAGRVRASRRKRNVEVEIEIGAGADPVASVSP